MIRYLAAFMFLASPAMAQWGPYGPGDASSLSRNSSGVATILCSTGASVGNGADTTEDIMQTCTVPAAQLANTGDRLHIVAAGTLGATTDTKSVKVRLGGIAGNIGANLIATITGSTSWSVDLWVLKTGSNTQTVIYNGAVASASSPASARSSTTTLTDTNTISIVVTGQNSTNSVAGSVTCQTLLVDYIHG